MQSWECAVMGGRDAKGADQGRMRSAGRSALLRRSLFAGACTIAILSCPAFAQESRQPSQNAQPASDTGAKIEIITVTAQRREQLLQDVPEAVSAFSGADLKVRGIASTRDLVQFTPNATFSANVGNLQVSMRGVGETWSLDPSADSAVAIYIDGIYQARPAVGNMDSIYANLDRIEVLRGPQGTLYGRNSIGGVINFITRDPSDELSVYGTSSYESYNTVDVFGGISGPIADNLYASIDIAGRHQSDGYSRNLYLDKPLDRTQSGRVAAKIKYDIAPDLTLKLSADYNNEHQDGPADQYPGIVSPIAMAIGGYTVSPNPRDIFSDYYRQTNVVSSGVTSEAAWDNQSFTLKSLTGFRKTRNDTYGLDFDGTQLNLFDTDPRESGSQFSQEFIFSSDTTESDTFQWIAGVFYLNESMLANLPTNLGPAVSGIGADATSYNVVGTTTNSLGIYADGTYRVTDKVSVTVGLRYNNERRSGVLTQCFFPAPAALPCTPATGYLSEPEKTSSSAPTGRFILTYKPQNHYLLYASASRGYRAGGLNNAGPGIFKPEYLTAYQAGLKANPMDDLQFDLSAFYYNDTDVQVQQVFLTGTYTSNASRATMKGVELEAIYAPTDSLTFDGQLSWLDARFGEFLTYSNFYAPALGVIEDPTLLNVTPVAGSPGLYNLAGSRMARSPDFKAHLGTEYQTEVPGLHGSVKFRYDLSWSDSYFMEYFNRAATEQKAYFMHDIRVSYMPDDSNWEFAMYVKNLGNQNVKVKALTVGGGVNVANVGLAPPRIVGGEISYRLNR